MGKSNKGIHVKFHAKNRYERSAISVFQVKFNMEFMSQVITGNFLGYLHILFLKRKPTRVSFTQMLQHLMSPQKAISNQLPQLSGANNRNEAK